MAAVTKLQLYNLACRALGERKLDSLTEAREARYVLDDIYDFGKGAVNACLSQGLWNHAMRAVMIDSDADVTPAFGFTYSFDVPTDYVRLVQISADEVFSEPLMDYEIEAGNIYADVDPIYVRYVSDDASFGGDLSLWPTNFSVWVGHWLAVQAAPPVMSPTARETLLKLEHRLLVVARSTDAQEEPTRFPPTGSWVSSRAGSRTRDRGKRGQLIG